MLNDNEYTEFEGRKYLNPQIALDESNSFIDNLRNTQKLNNQQIQDKTYNLGSALPSHQGGLGTGLNANSYFTSRYQVPQTNSAIENLRSAAQATALNQVLQNEQEKWKKRYNDAYRKYQKSAYDKANTPATTDNTEGGTDYIDNTNDFVIEGSVPGVVGGYTVGTFIPDWDNMTGEQTGIIGVPYGEEGKTNYFYDLTDVPTSVNGNSSSINPSDQIKSGIGGVTSAGLKLMFPGSF